MAEVSHHEHSERCETDCILRDINLALWEILRLLRKPTPHRIHFKELTMNPEGPDVTQVWTATPAPAGSEFPAGTTFTATPSATQPFPLRSTRPASS